MRCRARERCPSGRRTNPSSPTGTTPTQGGHHTGIICGIDWAETHDDIALADDTGHIVARARIGTGADGFNTPLRLIAENGGSSKDTPIAIETEKNRFVVALAEAGFTVYPINPRAVARYRERHGQADGKSDPDDAAVLANILRTDQNTHRLLPAISEHGRAVKALARQHQEPSGPCIKPSVGSGRYCLSSSQSLQAFPNLKHRAALTVLTAAHTPPSTGRELTRRRLESLLGRCDRRNDPRLVEQILTELKAPTLRQPPQVEAALGQAVLGPLCIIASMHQAVDGLEEELAERTRSRSGWRSGRAVPPRSSRRRNALWCSPSRRTHRHQGCCIMHDGEQDLGRRSLGCVLGRNPGGGSPSLSCVVMVDESAFTGVARLRLGLHVLVVVLALIVLLRAVLLSEASVGWIGPLTAVFVVVHIVGASTLRAPVARFAWLGALCAVWVAMALLGADAAYVSFGLILLFMTEVPLIPRGVSGVGDHPPQHRDRRPNSRPVGWCTSRVDVGCRRGCRCWAGGSGCCSARRSDGSN